MKSASMTNVSRLIMTALLCGLLFGSGCRSTRSASHPAPADHPSTTVAVDSETSPQNRTRTERPTFAEDREENSIALVSIEEPDLLPLPEGEEDAAQYAL